MSGMAHSAIDTIELRRFGLEDVPKIFEMSREPSMVRWIPNQVYGDEREAREVVASLIARYDHPDVPGGAPYVLGIGLQPDGELIGHVGLSSCPEGVEIGYAIEAAQQGKGYATSAVRAMVELGTASFGLDEVVGLVASDNLASCRVLSKCGFGLIDEAPRMFQGRMQTVRLYRWLR